MVIRFIFLSFIKMTDKYGRGRVYFSEKRREFIERNPNYMNEYYIKNKDRIRENYREWVKNDPNHAEKRRQYFLDNNERIKETQLKRWHDASPDIKETRKAEMRERYHSRIAELKKDPVKFGEYKAHQRVLRLAKYTGVKLVELD